MLRYLQPRHLYGFQNHGSICLVSIATWIFKRHLGSRTPTPNLFSSHSPSHSIRSLEIVLGPSPSLIAFIPQQIPTVQHSAPPPFLRSKSPSPPLQTNPSNLDSTRVPQLPESTFHGPPEEYFVTWVNSCNSSDQISWWLPVIPGKISEGPRGLRPVHLAGCLLSTFSLLTLVSWPFLRDTKHFPDPGPSQWCSLWPGRSLWPGCSLCLGCPYDQDAPTRPGGSFWTWYPLHWNFNRPLLHIIQVSSQKPPS